MRRGFTIALAGVVGLTALAPQFASAERRRAEHRHGVQRQAAAPLPARSCRPLCVADVTPCDPMNFKIADGRCQDPFFLF